MNNINICTCFVICVYVYNIYHAMFIIYLMFYLFTYIYICYICIFIYLNLYTLVIYVYISIYVYYKYINEKNSFNYVFAVTNSKQRPWLFLTKLLCSLLLTANKLNLSSGKRPLSLKSKLKTCLFIDLFIFCLLNHFKFSKNYSMKYYCKSLLQK